MCHPGLCLSSELQEVLFQRQPGLQGAGQQRARVGASRSGHSPPAGHLPRASRHQPQGPGCGPLVLVCATDWSQFWIKVIIGYNKSLNILISLVQNS